jgi:DNA-binding MarR family transcriptional regulator
MERTAMPTMYELCLMHARADRALRSVVTGQLESYHLTMMEWLALGTLSAAPKAGLSMTEVAAALDVTLPQVTALVSSLIKSKFIKQKVLASDRRGRQVMITLKGKRTLNKLESVIAVAMRDWSKDIPREQLYAYIDTVDQLARKN